MTFRDHQQGGSHGLLAGGGPAVLLLNDTTPGITDYPPNGTIYDQLDAHGITWKDYYTDLATAELYPPLYLKNVGTKIVPIAGFFTDAAAGTLPKYILVETKWNLPALTYRDANASAPLDMLDLRRPSFAEPPPLAQPLMDSDPGSLAIASM